MSLRINTNVDALTAYNNLNKTQQSQSTSNERLSSGLRINKAADDAAGLAISQGMTAQINGIGQAVRNAQDGINVVQTADGALTETHSILQRMRTLAVQAANDSNNTDSRKAVQTEVTQLNSELDRIAGATSFNGVKLLDGNFTGKTFQIGANNVAANDQINVDITSTGTSAATATWKNGTAAYKAGGATDKVTFTYGSTSAVVDMGASNLTDANAVATKLNGDADFASKFAASVDDKGGLVVKALKPSATATDTISTSASGTATFASADTTVASGAATGGFSSTGLGVGGVQVDTAAHAGTAIDTIDKAITAVSTARANLGAYQNRFQHTINNLTVTQQNLQASNSSIQDTDMAQEMSNFTRTQVLQNAGISMLAQANQSSQGILKLLG